jgi:predicted metal-dependent TIM-barrel fold hydrolase
MQEKKVLEMIDASPTGEVPSSAFFEGVHAQEAQKAVTNTLAKLRRTGAVKRGVGADGETVYSRMTDAERQVVADREAAKDIRRAEIAAEKAAKKGAE